MDGLLAILMIIWFMAKLFGKSKKKPGAARKAAGNAQKVKGFETLQSFFEQPQPAQPAAVQTSMPTMTMQAEEPHHSSAQRKEELRARFGHKLNRGESTEGFSRPLAPSNEMAANIAPGSLAYHSDEGKDICDPSLSHGQSSLEMEGIPVFAPHGENEPLFTAQDMLRGVVMNEILTRPVNRWRR